MDLPIRVKPQEYDISGAWGHPSNIANTAINILIKAGQKQGLSQPEIVEVLNRFKARTRNLSYYDFLDRVSDYVDFEWVGEPKDW